MQGSLWRQRRRERRGAPAHRWSRVRLPARLVSRWPPRGLRVLSGRRDRAPAARSRHRPVGAARRQRCGEHRAALVARRRRASPTPRPRTRAAGTSSSRRSAARRAERSRCGSPRTATAGCRATTTVGTTSTSRRPGRPTDASCILVSNRGHIWGSGGILANAGTARAATGTEIRNEETTWKAEPGLEPGRAPGGLRLLPRPSVAPALVDDRPTAATRCSSPTASSTRPRLAGRRRATASPTSRTRAATPRSGSSMPAAARGGASRRSGASTWAPSATLRLTVVDSAGEAAARARLGARRRRPELRARRRLAPRRRRLRPVRAALRVRLLPHPGSSTLTLPAGRVPRRGLARPRVPGRRRRRSPLTADRTAARIVLAAVGRPAGGAAGTAATCTCT